MEDATNFLEVFKFYRDIIEHPVEDYETKKRALLLPIVPIGVLRALCSRATQIFTDEKTVLQVNQDVTVVGDLHGHLLDLFRILKEFGFPPTRKYLFLGDIVDRGEFSMETLILILVMKVLWPRSVFVIRGNHEFSEMWEHCGFLREIEYCYTDLNVPTMLQNMFACVPIGALVYDKILCIHGGIGPSVKEVSMIQNLYKPIYSFDQGIITDLLWSDPSDTVDEFGPSPRGTGHLYGAVSLAKFINDNKLDLLVRGHECIETGVQYALDNKVVTVFSASTYCNAMNNVAGILHLKKEAEPEAVTFRPLKYVLRASAMFIPSQDENKFSVDKNLLHGFRATRTLSKLPTLSLSQKRIPLVNQPCSSRSQDLLISRKEKGEEREGLPKLDSPTSVTARKVAFALTAEKKSESMKLGGIKPQLSVPSFDNARRLLSIPNDAALKRNKRSLLKA